MDTGTIVASVCAAVAAGGAFYSNKKQSRSADYQAVSAAMQALQVRVDMLERELSARDAIIGAMTDEITVLKNLVTQRAEVEAVKDITLKIAHHLKVPM